MKKSYQRASFLVEAEKYEPGKGMEDGFCLWTDVITKGWKIGRASCRERV